MSKRKNEELKQQLRSSPDLPVKKICEYSGLKPFEFCDWLNGYQEINESKLQKINEYIKSKEGR